MPDAPSNPKEVNAESERLKALGVSDHYRVARETVGEFYDSYPDPPDDTVVVPNLISQLEIETLNDGIRWFGTKFATDIPYLSICLAGEAGEVANEVKKHLRGSTEYAEAQENVANELVDVLIYTLQMGACLGVDLFEMYKRKRAINEERFGGRAAAGNPGDGTGSDSGSGS